MPSHTIDVNFKGLLNICQSVVQLNLAPRIFHASTSEMFGQADHHLLSLGESMNESFPFNPASPYAVSKIASYYLVRYYRTVYKLKVSTAISFNHESPLRNESFITRKITRGAARLKRYKDTESLKLGNIYA